MGPFGLALAGFLLSAAATAALRPVARRLGVVAPPRPDRWHTRPVPLLGGAAIMLALAVSAAFFDAFPPRVIALLAGGLALFALGLVDDVRPLRPGTKLFGQMAVATLAIACGLELGPTSSPAVNALFTFVWIVGLTNAFNLLDNMDGLAAGVAAIATLFRLVFFLNEGDAMGAELASAFVGALLGFLVFNTAPASIFLGDAGSMPIGFLVAGLTLISDSAHTRSAVSVLVLPVLILLVPIFDTVFVTCTRILANRAVSVGGRDHTSHRLVKLGLSEREAVGILYAASFLGGAVAYFSRRVGFSYGVVLAALLLIGTGLAAILLSQVRIQYASSPLRDERWERRLLLGLPYPRQLATYAVDTASIVLAYYCAWVLRFETLEGANAARFAESLPVVVACQLLALTLFRIHRGAWRYAALSDVKRLVKGTLCGSVLTVLAIVGVFHFDGYSRAVVVLDALLLFAFLGGTRLGFLLLADFFRGRRAHARDVLVYGAGDLGEIAVRQLLQDRGHGRRPVGLLDDDPSKRGLEIHGTPVLGGGAELGAILASRAITAVVMADPGLPVERAQEIATTCSRHDVAVLPMGFLFR
jgi:UDP-GlcNAc:undecaprenyl-phosphate/decaprenyl-phosphate GlcNAc-1-phosphate transferase